MTSDETIQKAARVIQRARDAGPVYDEAGEPYSAAETIARALDDAGMLTPAPAHTQWGISIGGGDSIYTRRGEPMDREDAELMIAQRGNRPGEHLVRRLMTSWEAVE